MTDYYRSLQGIFRSMNANVWITTLREIQQRSIPQRSMRQKDEYSGTLIGYMLENGWFGYDGPDRNVGLRLAIEACGQESELLYDISALVAEGWIDCGDDLSEGKSDSYPGEYGSADRIVILTEGRADTWILSDSLRLLYPHLVEYFSFLGPMDWI